MSSTEGYALSPKRPSRIESIDYLRGFLALSVALYHFYIWSGVDGIREVHGIVYRTGIYAILMFYIISGISFGYVYRDINIDKISLGSFWIKRYFRLAPLYWFALIVGNIIPDLIAGREASDMIDVILNVTLTFGVIAPDKYMVIGGWSIGNEMFYYILFPFIVLALRRSSMMFVVLFAVSIGVGAVYAFDWITPMQTLSEQWEIYIQPASHLFYFVAGVGLSSLLVAKRQLDFRFGIPVTMVLVFVYLVLAASDGFSDNVAVVTGWRWAVYSLLAFGIVGAISLVPGQLPGALHTAFSWLGRVSYSVYLLHPVVWSYTGMVLSKLGLDIPRALVALPASLLAAHFIYKGLEAPMVKLGRRLASAFGQRYRRNTANAPASQW